MRFKIRALTALFVLLSAASVSITQAQTPAPAAEPAKPTEPCTISGNFGIYSQYIFRGLTQTDRKWTLNAHVGRQEYKGSTNGINNGDFLNYTDWKLGVTWLVAGYNVGAYYSDTNAKDSGYTIAGRNIGKSTGTVFIQKTF